jgi:microcompartment protein CcmK/EutM
MYLGTVTGRVVATVKNETLHGRKLLLVRRSHDGKTVVAIDSVGAGSGEQVYVCRGREASFAFRPDQVPSDATIVGIVDQIDRVDGEGS